MKIEQIKQEAKEIQAFVQTEIAKTKKNVKVTAKVNEDDKWVWVEASYAKITVGCAILRFHMFESGSEATKKENVLASLLEQIQSSFSRNNPALMQASVKFLAKNK